MSLRNSFGRYAVGAVRHLVLKWEPLMPKASNGLADREITAMTGTRRSKVSKETSSQTVTDSSSCEKSATPASMIRKPLTSCAVRPTFIWEDLEKVFADTGYRGDVAIDIEKDFGIELEVSNTPNGVKGFLPKPLRWVVRRTFGWLDSCGNSPATMRYLMNQRKK